MLEGIVILQPQAFFMLLNLVANFADNAIFSRSSIYLNNVICCYLDKFQSYVSVEQTSSITKYELENTKLNKPHRNSPLQWPSKSFTDLCPIVLL